VGAAALGFIVALICRVLAKEDAWRVIMTSLETGFYGGLGAWAGGAAGLIFAQLVPPCWMGLLLAVLAVAAMIFAILATMGGGGDIGWKLLGWLEFLAFAVGLAVVAVMSFSVPAHGRAAGEYETYLAAVSSCGAVAGLVDAILVGVYRSVPFWAGFALVPLNASWGVLGNLLGLMHRVASWNFYADHGAFVKASDRRLYTRFGNGFRVKHNFAFTSGWVMTAQNGLEKHEAIHVVQHLLLGPVFVLSYAGWFVLWFLPGAILGLIKRGSPVKGVNDMSYYDNPFEIMAYAVEGAPDDGQSRVLIFGNALAWSLTALWILASIAVAILLFFVRLSP
jgi:hypothetical protein